MFQGLYNVFRRTSQRVSNVARVSSMCSHGCPQLVVRAASFQGIRSACSREYCKVFWGARNQVPGGSPVSCFPGGDGSGFPPISWGKRLTTFFWLDCSPAKRTEDLFLARQLERVAGVPGVSISGERGSQVYWRGCSFHFLVFCFV